MDALRPTIAYGWLRDASLTLRALLVLGSTQWRALHWAITSPAGGLDRQRRANGIDMGFADP